MHYDRVLYLDCETFALDPVVASVREIAYVAEVDGKMIGAIQHHRVRPIFHNEDLIYGHMGIHEFCDSYNKKFHSHDPDRLVPFGFTDACPLFVHSKAALTFNVKPPNIVNPADWVVGTQLLSARQALMGLIEYLDHGQGRWILAGHNVQYDFNVLTHWARRLLGEENSKALLDKINKFIFLDTLVLCRWMQYAGKLKAPKANLGTVASELGIDTSNMHSALADVYACREIAYRLLNKGEIDVEN